MIEDEKVLSMIIITMDYPRPSRLSEPLGRLRDLTDIYGHSIPGSGPAWGMIAAMDARGPLQETGNTFGARGPLQETSTRQRKSELLPVQPQFFPGRSDAFGSATDRDASLIQYYGGQQIGHITSDTRYQRRMEDVTNRSHIGDMIGTDRSSVPGLGSRVPIRSHERLEVQPRENFSPGIAIGGSMRGEYTK